MSERANRRKIFLLFTLIVFFAIFVSNRTKDHSQTSIEVGEYFIKESVENIDQGVEVVERVFLELDEDLNILKEVSPSIVLEEKDVLGVGTCIVSDLVYESHKICSLETLIERADMRENRAVDVNEFIRRDSTISLREVKVPPLISGSPTMDSSVRQIHISEDGKDHWTLRPSGEMINKEIVQGNAYPGDYQTKGLLTQGQSTRTTAFAQRYDIRVGGSAEIVDDDGESEFTIYEYHDNDCGPLCRNYPNPTPGNYLVSSNIMAHSKNYPNYYSTVEEIEGVQLIEDCDEDSLFLDMDIQGTHTVACTPNIFQVAINFIRRILTPKDALDCSPIPEVVNEDNGEENNNSVDPRDECISVASIVIIMKSPWGAKVDCRDYVDGKCVTDFNELRHGNFNPPQYSGENKIYVLTDCKVEIKGLGIRDVKCAWDVDYIAKEFDFQAFDNVPNEEYPDRMEYLEFHVEESENRGDQVLPM